MAPQASDLVARVDDLESCLAIPLRVFVFICDRDKRIRPRAAARFQRMLDDPAPGTSEPLRQMLAFCRDRYRQLWRSYSASNFVVTPGGFLNDLRVLQGQLAPPDFEALKRELGRLAATLHRSNYVFLPGRAQKDAYADFRLVLLGIAPPTRNHGSSDSHLTGQPDAEAAASRPVAPPGSASTHPAQEHAGRWLVRRRDAAWS